MKKKLAVMFSGGRTSAYMCYWLLKNKQDEYNMTFVYCNTGQEHPNTLKFVDQCDKAFNLNLYWIEADVKKKGVGTSYKIVNYKTASLDGKPFEDVIKKFGLPNQDFPHCTRELKIQPFQKFAIDHIDENGKYNRALGIRADEPNRLGKDETYYYPLAVEKPMSKGDILLWWRKQSFDLEVPEHLGNCLFCYKKSDRKLLTIAKEYPEYLEFFKRMENKYSLTSNYDRKQKRFMFRGYKTTQDLLKESKKPFKVFTENEKLQQAFDFEECAEECGSVWND